MVYAGIPKPLRCTCLALMTILQKVIVLILLLLLFTNKNNKYSLIVMLLIKSMKEKQICKYAKI